MPNHWLGLTPQASIEDLISKGKLPTTARGVELQINIFLIDKERIAIVRYAREHPDDLEAWVVPEYTYTKEDPSYEKDSIVQIVAEAMQSPLTASDSPQNIHFSDFAFGEAVIELENSRYGGHILHLAILMRGMGHHIDPTNWDPYDDYKFESLDYLLIQTTQTDVTPEFYQSVINRARRYQNKNFTQSMSPAEIKKLFARMLGIEVAVNNQFSARRDIVEAAVLLQLRYLNHIPRRSASDWGLYLWPVSKEKLQEMKRRKMTEMSEPNAAAPRIYDVVGWLEYDDTSPRVELYQDFVPDDCIYLDYRLDQMKINWVKWRDYLCNEQAEEPSLEAFSIVKWLG
ncbi:hypothetical protein HII31_02637 [Pseudocercospora fuligena]|uniref:Uncharacterized protein n=1 Tax=Pseudocercospora fuligena TaxID=685502 RepID=A0A8H6RTM5_9PEZI|nr:hypothetical protein HII31_02637 [Pseudocercospora fuligena]